MISKIINRTNHGFLASVKQSIIYLILIPIIVVMLVVWVSYHRINDFRNNEINIASTTVNSTAIEITRVIAEKNKLLDIFVKNENDYIQRVARDPENSHLKKIIETKMLYYFKDYFAFTIADQSGKLIIDDYDGYIGEICLHDIKQYAKTGKNSIQVHPNPYVYHIDAISNIGNTKQEGYFFASFDTEKLSRLLKLSSPNSQSLMLLNTNTPDLIEITENGSRLTLNRNDYRLTNDERERIIASKAIPGSNWRVASFHDENLFSQYNRDIITIGIIIVLAFTLATYMMAITLWRSEKQRIALETSKEEMFSFFTHDLRAPLTSIYGTVQLLNLYSDSHGFDKQTKELVAASVENSEHMLSLINDLLDVQKLESGMMSFDFKRTELNAVIRDAINLNMRTAGMQFIKIHFEPTDELYADIDERRFQQMLTNLLSNAIKYSPQHTVVTVSLEAKGNKAYIKVADNGPGISPDVRDIIFEKFTQSTSRANNKVVGTGLGLSIVKYIIEQHHGQVSFSSEIGQGTQFTVEIPVISV